MIQAVMRYSNDYGGSPAAADSPRNSLMEQPKTCEAVGERTISASEFEAKCIELIDEVAAGGQGFVITKHGQPVARLVRYRTRPETLFGIDRGRFEIVGNVGDPIDVEWEAETGLAGTMKR